MPHADAAPQFRLDPLENRQLLAGSGLAGAYFARTNLTLARYSEVDSEIDLAWPSGTPHAALGNDGFSVRWTGQILGKFSETHTFTTVSSGGVRLWVNNFLLIDAWSDHELREDTGSCRLTAGKLFDIRLEYWSDSSDPQIRLDWESPRMSRSTVPSNRLYASDLDSTPPTTPTRFRASASTGNSITLIWDPSSDPSGVVDYDVYVGNTKVASNIPGDLSYTRLGLTPNTGYVFSVQAMDAAGNTSGLATTAVTTAAPSDLPPSVPTNVHVTNFTDTSVSLAWDASSDDFGVTGYRIYRNGVKMSFGPTSPNFVDTTAQPGTAYTYSIRSADNGGNFSGFSDVATVTTATSSSHDPFSGINATDYDSASGVSTSGSNLTSLDNNDWVRYNDVQFGGGANSVAFELALSPSNRGGTIELRLDSVNGTLIGTHVVQPTGSSTTFVTQRTNVANVTGTHDLYVVFKDRSDVARLRKVTFSPVHLTRIMALGDSITEGAQNPLTSTFRYYLWHKLIDTGLGNVDFVGSRTQAQNDVDPPSWDLDQNHEGHSGWTADQIAAEAAGWAAEFQPEIVMLHIGTNDLHNGQSVNSTITDIQNIIDNLRSSVPNVTIILAQILPLLGHESDVDLLNQGIAGIASSMNSGQSPIILVDMHSGITVNDLQDGIHPKPATEQVMADRWYAALAPLLQ